MQTDDLESHEKVLVARAQAGDERALAELLLSNDSLARSVVRKLGLNGEELDDVLQITHIRGWRAHDLILVTHNTGEFSRVAGLRIDDWESALRFSPTRHETGRIMAGAPRRCDNRCITQRPCS